MELTLSKEEYEKFEQYLVDKEYLIIKDKNVLGEPIDRYGGIIWNGINFVCK